MRVTQHSAESRVSLAPATRSWLTCRGRHLYSPWKCAVSAQPIRCLIHSCICGPQRSDVFRYNDHFCKLVEKCTVNRVVYLLCICGNRYSNGSVIFFSGTPFYVFSVRHVCIMMSVLKFEPLQLISAMISGKPLIVLLLKQYTMKCDFWFPF